eukprot:Gb_15438 [translate_table: standard]
MGGEAKMAFIYSPHPLHCSAISFLAHSPSIGVNEVVALSSFWTVHCNVNEERLSLLAFKDSDLADEVYSHKVFECCGWKGVHCDQDTLIVIRNDFYTSANGVATPSPTLFALKRLEYLDESPKQFVGVIPTGPFELQE